MIINRSFSIQNWSLTAVDFGFDPLGVHGFASDREMAGDGGDEEEGGYGAEESDSEVTESDSDDTPDQTHPRRMAKVSLPESSSKRQRQESSDNKYVPEHETERRKNRTIQGFLPKSFYKRHSELLTWSALAMLASVSWSSNLT
ncbi:hypothetical protein L1987_43257 [Smallanthus sonchifolius]|uniref:Uncharacterized protein n=1 Tax=Smallanthus sonchifolius TaxID=185202 RepID=A0ACB9GKW9_9ASTR|nr:hypothetical protein L1987_43257 [Smallanthus sonchifolius]